MRNEGAPSLVRQASHSARWDGPTLSTPLYEGLDDDDQDGEQALRNRNNAAMPIASEPSERVTRTQQVETLVDAVMDLHERALHCRQGPSVNIAVRDNDFQIPSTRADPFGRETPGYKKESIYRGRGSVSSVDSVASNSVGSSLPGYARMSDRSLDKTPSIRVTKFPARPASLKVGGGGAESAAAPDDPGARALPSEDSQHVVQRCDVMAFLEHWKPPSEGLEWLHVEHADTLHALAVSVRAHPLMLKLFFDMRPTTTVNHLDADTILVTAVAIFLEAAELHSHKLCIYATQHWIVTFEREMLTGTRSLIDTELAKDKVFFFVCVQRLHQVDRSKLLTKLQPRLFHSSQGVSRSSTGILLRKVEPKFAFVEPRGPSGTHCWFASR